jgi:hypothetical protein
MVEQQIKSFACGKLTLSMLLIYPVLSAPKEGALAKFAQPVYLLLGY